MLNLSYDMHSRKGCALKSAVADVVSNGNISTFSAFLISRLRNHNANDFDYIYHFIASAGFDDAINFCLKICDHTKAAFKNSNLRYLESVQSPLLRISGRLLVAKSVHVLQQENEWRLKQWTAFHSAIINNCINDQFITVSIGFAFGELNMVKNGRGRNGNLTNVGKLVPAHMERLKQKYETAWEYGIKWAFVPHIIHPSWNIDVVAKANTNNGFNKYHVFIEVHIPATSIENFLNHKLNVYRTLVTECMHFNSLRMNPHPKYNAITSKMNHVQPANRPKFNLPFDNNYDY